jgi:CRISPR-associated protein Cmr2
MEAGQYKEAYLSLERLLGSVKNVRPFAQYTYQNGVDFGERGRKCSLDGENNALFFGPGSNRRYVSNNNALLIPVANENEGLSAVSFVKRYWDPKRFPSTAGIATLNVERNGNEFNLKLFDLLFRNDDRFEEQLYFEENLTEQYFHKHGLTNFLENPGLAEIRRIHKLVFSAKKLCSYYAVLAFDGDHMGKWLSGVNLVTGVDLESFHKELSSKLSAFGREAKNIVDNERGKTVYAGGDDYLGFLNLHYLFKTVKELRQKFHELVNNQLNGKGAGNELTFSAGIVVAHYKEPLGMVVQKARDMEKAAKDQGNRNAFGLAVVKASGEIQQTVYKWDQEPDSPDGCSNWEALEKVFEGLMEDRLSNKFITSLSEEMYRLAGTILDEIDDSTANATAINDGLEREIERLVKKARNQQKNVNEEEARQVSDKINKLKQAAPKPKTRNFIHSLHIADFLSRKIKPA